MCFYQLFVCHKANFRPIRGGTLTHPVLITAQVLFRPEGHQEPRNKVGLQILAEKTVEFELGTFQNWKKRTIPQIFKVCLTILRHYALKG